MDEGPASGQFNREAKPCTLTDGELNPPKDFCISSIAVFWEFRVFLEAQQLNIHRLFHCKHGFLQSSIDGWNRLGLNEATKRVGVLDPCFGVPQSLWVWIGNFILCGNSRCRGLIWQELNIDYRCLFKHLSSKCWQPNFSVFSVLV